MGHHEKASVLISAYPSQSFKASDDVLYNHLYLLSPTPWLLPPLLNTGSKAAKEAKKVTKQG